MKKSEEILGMAVISIEDGRKVGVVKDLLINPSEGLVQYLIINNGIKYLGDKVLPFKNIVGVGEDVLTVSASSAIIGFEEETLIHELLNKDVQVIGTKVLTKKGKLIGIISEIHIDEAENGKIIACELNSIDGSDSVGIIQADKIVTIGKDVLVVSEEPETNIEGAGDTENLEKKPEAGLDAQIADSADINRDGTDEPAVSEGYIEKSDQIEENNQDETVNDTIEEDDTAKEDKEQLNEGSDKAKETHSMAAKLFEERQRKYLLGRKVTKRIETSDGDLLAEEGEVITEDLLDRAKAAGKFMELSLNTRP